MKREYAYNPEGYNQNFQKNQVLILFFLSWVKGFKPLAEQARCVFLKRDKKKIRFLLTPFLSLLMTAVLSFCFFLNIFPLSAMKDHTMENPSPALRYISITRNLPVDNKDEMRKTITTNDRYGKQFISDDFENYAHGTPILREKVDKQEQIMKISDIKSLPYLTEADKPKQQVISLPQLSLMLRDEDRDARKSAFKTLRMLLKKSEVQEVWERFCQEIPHMLEKTNKYTRRYALKALRELFREQSDEAWDSCQLHLVSLLENESTHVREAAKQLINQHDLIPHKVSHRVLRAIIVEDTPLETLCLPKGVKIGQLEKLKSDYQHKKEEIENETKKQHNSETSPSNLPFFPFYLILQKKYPDFSWKQFEKQVNLETPRVLGCQPSLLSLLLTDIKNFSVFTQLPSSLVSDFNKLTGAIQALHPNINSMARISKWLEAGLQGKSLILFSPVCPDYSVEKMENGLYRYTFNKLGSGVGLLAQRLLTILPTLDKFFKQYALPVKIKVALGDFEALSESNLQRLHLTFSEFLNRLKKSKDAIQKSSPIPIEAMMFTDLCGGFKTWNDYFCKYKSLLDQKEYGSSNLDDAKLIEIIRARKPLYDRWQGERSRLEDYLPQLLEQGAEYAAMGAIIAEQYQNCLILGVDQPVMSPFYNVEQPLPMLYLKPCYS